MACDAAIIPVVLGLAGARSSTWAGRPGWRPPKQFQALWIRDQGLHVPGLLEAPVVVRRTPLIWHWCDGGPTDLSNLALLCPRHHTIVHQRGYTATVTAFGVTWHL